MRCYPTIVVGCDCPCCEREGIVTIDWPPFESGDFNLRVQEAILSIGWSFFLSPDFPQEHFDLCTDCGLHGPKKIRKEREKDANTTN